jgi:hypothetical protein
MRLSAKYKTTTQCVEVALQLDETGGNNADVPPNESADVLNTESAATIAEVVIPAKIELHSVTLPSRNSQELCEETSNLRVCFRFIQDQRPEIMLHVSRRC